MPKLALVGIFAAISGFALIELGAAGYLSNTWVRLIGIPIILTGVIAVSWGWFRRVLHNWSNLQERQSKEDHASLDKENSAQK